MQKNDKMQIGQNAKILNIDNPKYSILGGPIENQCVKGGGLLYGGFGLPIFGIFCILSGLHFVCFDVLSHLPFVTDSVKIYVSVRPKTNTLLLIIQVSWFSCQ